MNQKLGNDVQQNNGKMVIWLIATSGWPLSQSPQTFGQTEHMVWQMNLKRQAGDSIADDAEQIT